ncbi:MAG: transposase [Oscillospiraceae bacterium]|nr:transposase [Oscillospiraceae bacterium]
MILPKRKPNRLENYDYASNGGYFLTFCTQNRACLLSQVFAGATDCDAPEIQLTKIGQYVNDAILSVPGHYPNVVVDSFVIMPNHVHLLLRIENDGRLIIAPTVSRIVKQCKTAVTKQCGIQIWQKGFYDHIVRDQQDFLIRAKYIADNPAKWLEDEYYSPHPTIRANP